MQLFGIKSLKDKRGNDRRKEAVKGGANEGTGKWKGSN
jgi:hypothetical protein